jgi:hypothetical protein
MQIITRPPRPGKDRVRCPWCSPDADHVITDVEIKRRTVPHIRVRYACPLFEAEQTALLDVVREAAA